MREDIITMSTQEVKRLNIVPKVLERQLTQVKAGEVLGISDRKVRRLAKRLREQGAEGLVHRNRGRLSPHKMPKEREARIGMIIEKRYHDFGPTLASEKLDERHGIKVSREKLRQIMISKGIWRMRREKKRVHQWRERKHYYGEMIQMDGSQHDWLEGRGPEMVFMGYIDDATGQVYGRFYDYEGVYPAS
ncbi:ISNCY family transposase ISLad2 [subsurface metagenome]